MIDPRGRIGIKQRDNLPRQIATPSRLPTLVVDHRDLRLGRLEGEHGLDEVCAVHAVEPGGSHDVTPIWKGFANSNFAS